MDSQNSKSYMAPLKKKLEEGTFIVGSIGAGYVGAITSIILAARQPNLKIIVSDVMQEQINKWNEGRFPFYEPDLEKYYDIAVNQNKNITFTADVNNCIEQSDALFICVNTPPKVDSDAVLGKEADMTYFDAAIRNISNYGNPEKHKILIEKSTVPVGTYKRINSLLGEKIEKPETCFTIVNMPEFLAEGLAVQRLLNPDRIVIGTTEDLNGQEAFEVIKGLYTNTETLFLKLRTPSSELAKLFINGMLAQRVTSMNSMTYLCEKFGGSIQEVQRMTGTDPRIGPLWLQASPGFGGSCFEKDILSLIYIFESEGQQAQALYWKALLNMNDAQKHRILDMIISEFPEPESITLTLFGFAFKKNTSDTRLTAIAYIANGLIHKGYHVKIHDPKVTERSFHFEMEVQGFNISERTNYEFCGSDYRKAVTGSSAIIIGTEWDEYNELNYSELITLMNADKKNLYDFRSYVDVKYIQEAGFNKVFKLGN